MSRYTVATDGACMRNPGPAGWAWVGEDGRWAAGSLEAGTNNIGELLAVLYAIRDNADRAELHIQADSMYAINSYQTWMDAHARRGWKTSTGAPTKNADILAELMRARDDAPRRGDARCHVRTRQGARRPPPQRLGRRACRSCVAARQSRARRDLVDRPRAGADRRHRRRAEGRRGQARPETLTAV